MKKHRTRITLLAISFAIILPTLLPLMRQEFFHLHDFTHVTRLVELHRALFDGHFPVRWSQNLGFGYGLPQFNFYAPLPYYLAAIPYTLGVSAIWSIKLLIIGVTIAGFWAMYQLGKSLFNPSAGLIAATAFTYLPYRALDTYVRGALGELTAITFIALSLYALAALVKKPSLKLGALAALPLAAIPTSHNLTAFISFPAIFILTIVLGSKQLKKSIHRNKNFMLLLLPFVLAIGLSAFYTFPAFLEKGYTRIDTLTQGFSNYAHHFLYLRQFLIPDWGYGGSISGLEDDISFHVGTIHVILGIITGLGLLLGKIKTQLKRKLFWGSISIILVSMLMSSYKSQFIWDKITPLHYIQFPWRFLTIITVMASILTAGSLWWIKKQKAQTIATAVIVLLFIIFNTAYFKPKEYLTNSQALYYTDPARIQTEMSGIIPDFMPETEAELPLNPPTSRVNFNPKPNNINYNINQTHEFYLKTSLNQPTTATVNIAYFPGWQLYLNGEPIEYRISPYNATMTTQINQTGDITLAGKFHETPLRKTSNALSLVSGLIVVGSLLPKPKGNYERH